MRYRAVVRYDGTQFRGFQIQTRERTVQGTLQEGLERLTGDKAKVVGAGRTDAGVHAEGQVVHFDLGRPWETGELRRALNAVLPPDVGIRRIEEAGEGFHARFSAVSREYRYTLHRSIGRDPLMERYAYGVSRELDDRSMDAASRALEGTRDFGAFGSDPTGRGNTVRYVFRARCLRKGSLLTIRVVADAFLRHMMRTIAGALVRVGAGERDPEWMEEVVAGDMELNVATMPAHALALVRVKYDESDVHREACW